MSELSGLRALPAPSGSTAIALRARTEAPPRVEAPHRVPRLPSPRADWPTALDAYLRDETPGPFFVDLLVY